MRVRVLAWLALPALLSGQKPAGHDDPAIDRLPKVLWRDPGVVPDEHWRCGPGGCGRTPAPPYRLEKEEGSGTNPKITVKDSHGLSWSVKFGAEVIPECFASRFVTAVGYFAEPTYFVSSGNIEHSGPIVRARRVIKPDGSFERARFELRGQKDLEFLSDRTWGWNGNESWGPHQMAGLKILMLLLSNWDNKDSREPSESNNGMFVTTHGSTRELWYGVFDWGASLGRWGGWLRRDQSDCSGYARDTPRFIKGLRGSEIEFGFSGKHTDLKNGITLDDARWLAPYLRRAGRNQLLTGLKAAGATERQSRCWAESIENRIRQLDALAR